MRPTKFTAALGAEIVRAKATGCTHEGAAAAAGIGERTLRTWLEAGEQHGREPYATFARAFRKAENQHRRKVVREAERAMNQALNAA